MSRFEGFRFFLLHVHLELHGKDCSTAEVIDWREALLGAYLHLFQ
jgi:hypothetical protein